MNGTHIGDFFPELFNQAIGFHDTVKPIVLILITAGILIHGYLGMNGDIGKMWKGIVNSVIIVALIYTLPEIVNDIQLAAHALTEATGANPSNTSEKFGNLIVGNSANENEDVGFMDILFADKGGFGKAMLHVVLMVVSFFALVIQYIFVVAQQGLILFAIALSPIFLSFFMLDSLKGIAVKYFLGLVAVLMWPLGWSIADLMTTSLLERAANAGIYEDGVDGFVSTSSQSLFFVAVISLWLLITTIASPLVMNIVVTNGANAGGALFSRVGSALGLGASYGLIAKGTAELSGASNTRAATTSAIATGGGLVAGAGGTSGLLLPTIIGMSAAKNSIGGKDPSGEPTDYNAEAAEISKKKKS